MSDAVTAAIAQAQANAAQAAAAQAANVPTLATPAGVPAAYTPPGRSLTLEDMGGGITVDSWLGVSEHGFLIGADKTLYQGDIVVDIDFSAVAYSFAVKFGNPAIYLKSYDGVTCADGGSWAAALQRAQSINPSARHYPSADVPMKLLHDIVVTKGKTEVKLLEAGITLGNSMSTTNFPLWKKFALEAQKGGHDILRTQLGVQRMKNKAGNDWGIITFTPAPVV